jgi:hypothetical protein
VHIAQHPVANAHTLLLVTSGSPVGHAQWFILHYYYRKKKTRETAPHANAITSVTFGYGQGRFR